jgi:hypothetical protein
MPWTVETDPSEMTWSDTLLRSDDGRLLWLRAGEGVEGAWLLQDLDGAEPPAVPVREREVPVSDAVALAPEAAIDLLRATRGVLERYAERDPESGARLAEELRDAVRLLERGDVPGTSEGRHTHRGADRDAPLGF